MSSAWLLPEHIADVLPARARRIEDLRRTLLDLARSYGFELVMPPLLEHLESLLSGTGHELDLKTFKLVDQLSGRTLGVRADTTPQAARIDAHLLNREGVTRLCYCGPVLHTRPAGLHASREPLQFGAEIFGCAGLEADLEIQEFALDGLVAVGVKALTIDLGDARVVRSVLSGVPLDGAALQELVAALTSKDAGAVRELSRGVPEQTRTGMLALLNLYGDDATLSEARRSLPPRLPIARALDDLQWLAAHLRQAHPDVKLSFDLSDMSGYAYYSGVRFTVFGLGSTDVLLRGGRYDEIGAVFGRNRPAVGCSLDLKSLAALLPASPRRCAIRAPWSESTSLRAAVRHWRSQGETVVCALPQDALEGQEFTCDRALVEVEGRWQLQAIRTPSN